MQALSGERLLAVWDEGQAQHSLQCALTTIASGAPEIDPRDLPGLPLTERDRLLLKLRELTFGPTLEATATCPRCGTVLEFAMPIGAVLADLEAQGAGGLGRMDRRAVGECVVRAATTLDLPARVARRSRNR